jgi:hypothetical protein
MQTDKIIISFSQSEKIKAGILWLSSALNIVESLPGSEKKGAEKIIGAMINMMGQEIRLAGIVTGLQTWPEIEPDLDKAVVMIESGVSQDAVMHLTKALSKVTNIGQQSMTALKEHNLL